MDMFSDLLVGFYRVVHGRLHLPGAGWLLRKIAPMLPGLQAYPLPVPGVGVALLDFRDVGAYSMVNFFMLGELGSSAGLHQCLEKALQPGDVFWDVGANVGVVSGHFAHPRFKLSSLHAFEPNPGPLKTLQSMFPAQGRCIVHPFGLGDQDQMITLNLSSDGSLVASMARDFGEGQQIQVQVRRGDAVRRDLRLLPPQVIKVDVEGFEPSVFAGLTDTIAEHRPILVFEHNFLSDAQIRELAPKDYLLYLIQNDGSLETDISMRSRGFDAMLVPVEKAARFRTEPCRPESVGR
jgi:FkbM family methyltransferase